MAEPLRATFFALQKREKMVLLPATIVFMIIVALIAAAFVALNWRTFSTFSEFTQMAANQASGTADPEVAGRFVLSLFGLFGSALLFAFPLYVAIAAYEAACLRWMIRGEAPGLFGLTLNNDTWRVYGVYWVWFIGQFVVSMAFGIILMPLMFASMGEVMQQPDPEAMWRWQLKMQAISLIQYLPLIFLGVRFGAAAATSVARRRFSFFQSWSATEDRFFALFGSYALVTVPVLVLCVAVWLGAVLVQFGSWSELLAMWTSPPTPERMQEMSHRASTPVAMAVSLASLGVYVLLWLIWAVLSYGINARAALAALDEGKIAVDSAD